MGGRMHRGGGRGRWGDKGARDADWSHQCVSGGECGCARERCAERGVRRERIADPPTSYDGWMAGECWSHVAEVLEGRDGPEFAW